MIPSSFPYHGFTFTTRPSRYQRARLGELQTPHGTITTPNFILCGTRGTVKGLMTHSLHALGVGIILANTYHLMLRPGGADVAKMGGLSGFTGFDGPTLTDSGGFQIFSLGRDKRERIVNRKLNSKGDISLPQKDNKNKHALVKITEEGAIIRSVYDGALLTLTPELSIAAQGDIGADFILVLDECTDSTHDAHYFTNSLNRTHRWSDRSLRAFLARDGIGSGGAQALYGIIQGGTSPTLREQAIGYVNERPFFGHAIGGTLGNGFDAIQQTITHASQGLAPQRPIHLLGIGDLSTVFYGVLNGIDTFDCVSPTRVARHGWALVKPSSEHPQGRINLRNQRYRDDTQPIEKECDAPCCNSGYQRGYISHLVRTGELLGSVLLTMHNVRRTMRFMEGLRLALSQNDLDTFAQQWHLNDVLM